MCAGKKDKVFKFVGIKGFICTVSVKEMDEIFLYRVFLLCPTLKPSPKKSFHTMDLNLTLDSTWNCDINIYFEWEIC